MGAANQREIAVSRALDDSILKRLREGAVSRVTTADDLAAEGINQPRIVTFEDGTRALFKPIDSRRNPSGLEVAAYEISRELGVGRVPPTIERSVDGLGMGSLQLFIEGAKTRNALRQAGKAVPALDPEAIVFIYLIGEMDALHNLDNQLLVTDQPILILADHGLAFHPEIESIGLPTDLQLQSALDTDAGQDLAMRIRLLGESRLRPLLAPLHLSEERISALLARRKKILSLP